MKQFNTSRLKRRLALLLFSVCFTGGLAYAQAPANDNCSGAVLLPVTATCTPVSGTTVNATQSSGMPDPDCGSGSNGWDDDVWYSFTPAAGQTAVDINFASVAGENDLVAQIYSSSNNSCGGNLSVFACSDDDGGAGLPQFVNLAVVPGTTYFVRVFSYSSDPGTTGTSNFNICVQLPPPPPANDNCSGAVALTVSTGATCTSPTSGTTVSATQSNETPPSTNADGTNDDVWYTFTATSGSQIITLDNINGTTSDMAMAVYSGSCGSLTFLQYSDPESMIVNNLILNQTYYLRVWTFSSSAADNASFSVCVTTPPPPPANDNCSGAVALTVSTGATCTSSTSGTTVSATQSNETPPSTNADGTNDDVWYTFTATSGSQTITLDNINGTTSDMAMAVYSGSCGSLTFLQYSDPESMTITSLTPNQTYYLRVWTFPSSAADNASFSVCVTTPPPAPSCVTNISPVDAATNVAIHPDPLVLSWHADPTAEDYTVYIGTSAASASSYDNTSDTTLEVTGLDFSTTYYWYVVPENVTGSPSGCEANATSFTTEVAPPAPANDNCTNAVALTVSNGFSTAVTLGTTLAATTEGTFGIPVCGSDDSVDVWYTVTVPASGNVTIQSSAVNEFVTDMVMEVYSGTCGALTQVDCDDDGNPDDDSPSSAHSRIELTGQVPGTVFYVREVPYDPSNRGAFAISAWDPTVLPVVSPGGNCIAANAVTIDPASDLYRWTPIFDGSGNIVAEIFPNGNALGTINSSVYVNSGAVRQGNGVYYLDRNITITPATQPVSAVKVRMYLLNTELSALETADPDVTGLVDLNFSKNEDPCQSAVAGATTQFDQTNSDVYGTDGGFIEFDAPSFSSIYARGGTTTPLPVELTSISAANRGDRNRVDWSTAKEDAGEYFELERGADGKKFTFLARINAKGMAAAYTWWDNAPLAGTSYYRLKITNNEGKKVYSNVVNAIRNDNGALAVTAAPNPASDKVKVSIRGNADAHASITLNDITGRLIRTIPVNNSEVIIDMNGLTNGVYLIRYTDDSHQEMIKISKQ